MLVVQIAAIQFNPHAGGTYKLFYSILALVVETGILYSIPTLIVQTAAIKFDPHTHGTIIVQTSFLFNPHAHGTNRHVSTQSQCR